MKNPKVSVIIPTYMEEKYIESTLKALKNQTFKDFEIIVSDSDSKDNTAKIARKYADKTIVVKKRGIALGRNIGAKSAHGDIFLFLDADTDLDKNFLENIVHAFSDASIVLASGLLRTTSESRRAKLVFHGTGELAWILSKIGRPAFYGICLAVRKDVFRKLGGFSEQHETAEDIDFTERASKLGKCIVVRSAIAYTSPRRLKMGGTLYAVFFHIVNYLRYRIM